MNPHIEVHSSAVSRWIKENELEIEKEMLMLIFLKVTLHIEPLPQKHVYQVFQ